MDALSCEQSEAPMNATDDRSPLPPETSSYIVCPVCQESFNPLAYPTYPGWDETTCLACWTKRPREKQS